VLPPLLPIVGGMFSGIRVFSDEFLSDLEVVSYERSDLSSSGHDALVCQRSGCDRYHAIVLFIVLERRRLVPAQLFACLKSTLVDVDASASGFQ